MADSHSRRLMSNPAVPNIPPAPPLPEPRRNAFTRFVTQPFSYASRPATAQAVRESGRTEPLPRTPGFNPLAEQAAKFNAKAAAEIAALDINQSRTHAVLAGKDILQTIRIEGPDCVPEVNIRDILYSHDKYSATRHRDNLDIHDVKWSHGVYSNIIACAATNGKVVLYDLTRPNTEIVRLHEHARQVHKVAFSPHQGALLLSASHDHTLRLWDLRDLRAEIATIGSRAKFNGQSEAIRDVRWSPSDVLEFAFGTDSGVIQRWDHRNPKGAKLRINAHDGGCKSIDWHPHGKHLLSAGWDRSGGSRNHGTLKVWDFSTDQGRQKPTWTLRTPFTLSNARWRPPCRARDDHGLISWHANQIVSSYDEKHPAVHLWDLRRPSIPFKQIQTDFRTAPTDFLWHSTDLLWAVSREGDFKQIDVTFAPTCIEQRPLSTFAVSPAGELVAFGQKRSRRRQASDYHSRFQDTSDLSTRQSTPRSGIPTLTRSSFDDSLDDNFLSSESALRNHERSASNRSTKSLAGTPPSQEKEALVGLEESLASPGKHSIHQQNGLHGLLPGSVDLSTFSFLARKYKVQSLPSQPSVQDYQYVSKAFERNASYAKKAGKYRAAQAWMLAGTLLQHEAMRNGEHMRKQRLSKVDGKQNPYLNLPEVELLADGATRLGGHTGPDAYNGDGTGPSESGSNMPTPIARPYPGGTSNINLIKHLPPEFPKDDHLSLPPSVVSGAPPNISLAKTNAEESGGSLSDVATSSSGPDWFRAQDLNERRAQISGYTARSKAVVDLDPLYEQASAAMNIPPAVMRHNSDESFAMFPSSAGSRQGSASIPASLSSMRERLPSMTSIAEHFSDSDLAASQSQTHSGPASFSPSKHESSQDSGSGTEFFNSSFNSAHLLESPRGTRSERTDRGPSQTGSNVIESPKHPNLPSTTGNGTKTMVIQDFESPAPAVKPVSNMESAELVLEDFTRRTTIIDERPYPITSGDRLKQLFTYHTAAMPDAQNLFHLAQLMKPLLPNTTSLPAHKSTSERDDRMAQTRQMLQEYAQYCQIEMNLSPEDTRQLLEDPLAHLARFGMHPLQAEAVFTSYQEQLERCRLFIPATLLRRQLYPSYAVFREHVHDPACIPLTCLHCGKPVGAATKKCERCAKTHDPCPVCWQRFTPFLLTKRARKMEESKQQTVRIAPLSGRLEPLPPPPIEHNSQKTSKKKDVNELLTATHADTTRTATAAAARPRNQPCLWQFCLTCGHGAHAACLQIQQRNPDVGGRCPVAECECACIPGPYRKALIERREAEQGAKAQGSVRPDRVRARESGAVKGVRGILQQGAVAVEEREERRVRLVEPDKGPAPRQSGAGHGR